MGSYSRGAGPHLWDGLREVPPQALSRGSASHGMGVWVPIPGYGIWVGGKMEQKWAKAINKRNGR